MHDGLGMSQPLRRPARANAGSLMRSILKEEGKTLKVEMKGMDERMGRSMCCMRYLHENGAHMRLRPLLLIGL